MANFGLSKPWMAKYNTETDTYTGGFKCGKAISTSVTPAFNEAPLFADNQQTENIREFKNANVTLGVDRLPLEASEVVFGHEVGKEGEEISRTEDSANYVGYCFITAEMLDGVRKYRACLLRKVKFQEGEESYETKGDSIAFKTPSLSGVAMGTNKTDWRIKSPYFDTEEEADEWCQTKLNVKKKCETPVASVEGGTYTDAQTVTLKTGTDGAKILYTTNGTTPGEENGTEYSVPIQVSASMVIRALACKDGMIASGVLTEEYVIVNAGI